MRGLQNKLWALAAIVVWIGAGSRAQVPKKTHPIEDQPKVTQAQIAAGMTFGVKTAPITIEEYSDFECPACRGLYLEALRPLIDDYVSSGKVYLVHHNFPLPIHTYARQAAAYADAAAAIGRFGRVEEALFSHQAEWAADGKFEPILAAVLTPSELKEVEAVAHSNEVAEAVQDSVNEAQQIPILQTPTMFIIHKGQRTPIVGMVSYPVLRRYLDALLQE